MKDFREKGFNDALDLDTLLFVFLNRFNTLVKVFLAALVSMILIYIFQERVYQSETLLKYEKNKSILPSDYSSMSFKTNEINAEKEIFRSLTTIEGAKARLARIFTDQEISFGTISSGISFSDDGQDLLTVKYVNNDDETTQIILQSLVEEYISDRVENNKIIAKKSIEFINSEIPKLQEQLKLAEIELTDFKTLGGNSFIFDNESRGDSIDSLKNEIKEIELKEIELREFYKSSHPIYSTLIEQKNILLDELEELESDIKDLPSDQRKLVNLTQKVNIYSSSLEELEKQRLNLSINEASSTSNIRVINGASSPSKISPSLALLTLSLLFPLVLYNIFLFDHFFTDKIISLDSLLDFLEERSLLLGAFPLIGIDKKNKNVLEDIEKNFSDRIVVNILNSDSKVFLISSMKAGVGKSYFSEKLFNQLSKVSDKICLLDLDLRKKGISEKSESLSSNVVTIDEYLSGNSTITGSYLIKKPQLEDPLQYLNSEQLEILINKLKEDFDKIIIDSPPMGTFVDAKLIANYSDKVISILSAHESSFSEVPNLQNELQDSSNSSVEVMYFLNKVRYFIEIFWFKFKYPLYGNYQYYNPYPYYSETENLNSFQKIKKYVSFAKKTTYSLYFKYRDVLKRIFDRKK